MKKIMIFTALAVILPTYYAMAEDGAGQGKADGHRGGKMFERMDTDGDGIVTKREFLSFFEERFDNMDADGNGEVTKREALQYHKDKKDKRGSRGDETDRTRDTFRDGANDSGSDRANATDQPAD